MIRSAYKGGRGGHRGSSNPSSPSQLNYITQGPKDMAARDPGSARKRKVSPSGSPQPRSALRDSVFTPDRPSRRLMDDSTLGDGSPLPRIRKTNGANSSLTDTAPRSPTLASSYLPDDAASFVTPAPHRVHPEARAAEHSAAAEPAHADQLSRAVLEVRRDRQHPAEAGVVRPQPVAPARHHTPEQQSATCTAQVPRRQSHEGGGGGGSRGRTPRAEAGGGACRGAGGRQRI